MPQSDHKKKDDNFDLFSNSGMNLYSLSMILGMRLYYSSTIIESAKILIATGMIKSKVANNSE